MNDRMPYIAVIGAGPIGATVAHTLARRGRVRDIRLFDSAASVAAGKALDIRQSGPVEGFDTRLTGGGDLLGAVGAAVTVIADDHGEGPWSGDRGLSMVARLRRAGLTAPIVFAGTDHTWLMEACVRELGIPARSVIGTAASALVGAARSLVALEVNGSGVDVSVTLCGRPPALTFGWASARVGDTLVTDRIPPHRLLAIAQQVKSLWPVGPYAIAAATAPVVEALSGHGRRECIAATVLEGELGVRGVAALMPVRIGRGLIQERITPTLSPQERNELLTTLSRSSVTG